jgi:hypothetical protein
VGRRVWPHDAPAPPDAGGSRALPPAPVPAPLPDVVPVDADVLDLVTGRLRRQLAITIVARAARGQLPTPDDITVVAELQALAGMEEGDEQAVDGARGGIGANSVDHDLRALGQILLSGLNLDDGEPLAIVPYRELATIPLAALLLPDGRRVAGRAPAVGNAIDRVRSWRHGEVPAPVLLQNSAHGL